jgi:hypothetical protein
MPAGNCELSSSTALNTAVRILSSLAIRFLLAGDSNLAALSYENG